MYWDEAKRGWWEIEESYSFVPLDPRFSKVKNAMVLHVRPYSKFVPVDQIQRPSFETDSKCVDSDGMFSSLTFPYASHLSIVDVSSVAHYLYTGKSTEKYRIYDCVASKSSKSPGETIRSLIGVLLNVLPISIHH